MPDACMLRSQVVTVPCFQTISPYVVLLPHGFVNYNSYMKRSVWTTCAQANVHEALVKMVKRMSTIGAADSRQSAA